MLSPNNYGPILGPRCSYKADQQFVLACPLSSLLLKRSLFFVKTITHRHNEVLQIENHKSIP